MKQYYISLLSLTAVLVAVAFFALHGGPSYLPILPLTALYFCIVTGIQHYIVIKALDKSPRSFVKGFMGVVVGTLFLHLIVFAVYLFTHIQQAKIFAIGFCIGYAVYLTFETTYLALIVSKRRKNNK